MAVDYDLGNIMNFKVFVYFTHQVFDMKLMKFFLLISVVTRNSPLKELLDIFYFV
jgi:hypothetical protein